MCFVFFNQKTAYEMLISDWSSDVCSSDLCGREICTCADALSAGLGRCRFDQSGRTGRADRIGAGGHGSLWWTDSQAQAQLRSTPHAYGRSRWPKRRANTDGGALRSEEHTSELQALMRTTYAVHSSKKKT